MNLKCGGLEGGWMQVVNINITEEESCPGAWQYITTPRSLCQGSDVGCSLAHFYTNEIPYEHICGQVVGYQKGSTDAFVASQIVSPTFVSDKTLIPVVIKPISPVFSSSIFFAFGVNTPTFSTI